MVSQQRRLAGLVVVCLVSPAAATYAQKSADPVAEALKAVPNVSLTPPLVFVGITPCRLVDTRGNGFSGPFGPPALDGQPPGGTSRLFPVAGNCGIPATAQAVSANFAVTNTTGTGFISVWPGGQPQPVPLVASMNFSAGQTIANAVLVPLGGGGGINVLARVTTDLVIDVNGYFEAGVVLANQSCGAQVVKGFDPMGNVLCGDPSPPFATFVGAHTNIPISALTGWTQCYSDTYANSGTPVATILAACPGNNLLLACRLTGQPTLITLAHAPRADVLFDCGNQTNCVRPSNGANWYFSDSYSWGFAAAGQAVNRDSCDIGTTFPAQRLCWHTGGGSINGGFRCGLNDFLNSNPAFERLIFQAN